MKTVNIISGWSNPGGSTIHHINLTNILNANGHDCTFYGPHEWHLDKCDGVFLKEWEDAEGLDVTISHFCQLREKPKGKHILSLHETNLFPLNQMDLSQWDLIHYVSNRQRAWHNVNHPYVIIPPSVDFIKLNDPPTGIAGVIGSIDSHKQTHIAIREAFKAGYDKVLLFGEITELSYFNDFISKDVLSNKVVVMNHCDDKEEMYDQISAVFHYSKRETYGMVEAECNQAGIPFFGNKNNPEVLTDGEILKRWEKVLV
tara:strand:+ start:4932 stop:5705 length:774 start_codon:yes stop_codon:yes gene_type:complete